MRIRVSYFFLLIFFLMCQTVYAGALTYQVSYDPKSTMKGPSLKQATLVLQLYLHGNTQKKLTVLTDDNHQFSIEISQQSKLIVEVISIQNAPKNMHCHGVSSAGKTSILLRCDWITQHRLQ